MEQIINIKPEYNTLNKLHEYLNSISLFECSVDYDKWDVRTNHNGQMEHCLIIRKNAMHAIKLYFIEDNSVMVNHIIPNSILYAYFGKSFKRRQNIIEIITGKIKAVILSGFQQKAFDKLLLEVKKASLLI